VSAPDFREQLTGYLRDLHLPAIRRTFEEKARRAEQETLSYERYLFELIELECQERREHRITRLLQGSKLPLEKTLENFHLQRLPPKAAGCPVLFRRFTGNTSLSDSSKTFAWACGLSPSPTGLPLGQSQASPRSHGSRA
jgi:hypothetical protein